MFLDRPRNLCENRGTCHRVSNALDEKESQSPLTSSIVRVTLRFLGFLGNRPDWNACQKSRGLCVREMKKGRREAAALETTSGGRKSQTSNRQFHSPYEQAACLNKNQPDLRSEERVALLTLSWHANNTILVIASIRNSYNGTYF